LGLYPDLYPGGVISLHYADDVELASNLKRTLTCFEQVSGMRMSINFSKSELIPINMDDEEAKPLFRCFQLFSRPGSFIDFVITEIQCIC
jgi:hypothetical protein